MRSAESGVRITCPMPGSHLGMEIRVVSGALVLTSLVRVARTVPRRLLRDQVDLTDATLHVQADGHRRVFVARINPPAIAFLQSADIDLADSSRRRGGDSDAAGHVH